MTYKIQRIQITMLMNLKQVSQLTHQTWRTMSAYVQYCISNQYFKEWEQSKMLHVNKIVAGAVGASMIYGKPYI